MGSRRKLRAGLCNALIMGSSRGHDKYGNPGLEGAGLVPIPEEEEFSSLRLEQGN